MMVGVKVTGVYRGRTIMVTGRFITWQYSQGHATSGVDPNIITKKSFYHTTTTDIPSIASSIHMIHMNLVVLLIAVFAPHPGIHASHSPNCITLP